MKILVTDLDRTLFYPKDKKAMICKENLDFVRNFIDKGNKLVVCSGRSIDYCKRVERRINRPIGMICYNGAVSADGEDEYAYFCINNKQAEELIDIVFDEYKIPGVFIMTDDGVFVRTKTKVQLIRRFYKFCYEFEKIYAETFHLSVNKYDYELKKGNIHKIMLYFGVSPKAKKKAREINRVLRENYSDLEFSWSNNVIEITNVECSKGNAIKQFIKHSAIDRNNVYVVGDSGNDISMFKAFHENSFCLSHGHKAVKKYASHEIDKFIDLEKYLF